MKIQQLYQIAFCLFAGLFFTSFSKPKYLDGNPVHFSYQASRFSGKVFEVKITASIDEPWHIYSQFTPDNGPSLPTRISFSKNPLVEFIGTIEEKGNLITKHEESLDVTLRYFTKKVVFVQKIRLKSDAKTNVTGEIEYMACTNSQCLLPTTKKFSVEVNN